jgi:hypothetical protein
VIKNILQAVTHPKHWRIPLNFQPAFGYFPQSSNSEACFALIDLNLILKL